MGNVSDVRPYRRVYLGRSNFLSCKIGKESETNRNGYDQNQKGHQNVRKFFGLAAIGIGIGVVTLIGSLGITVPAIRLSVIGALQYETQMADGAAKAITGSTDGLTLLIQRGVTAQDYATIVTLMTVAIIAGPVLVVLFYKNFNRNLPNSAR